MKLGSISLLQYVTWANTALTIGIEEIDKVIEVIGKSLRPLQKGCK